MVAISLSGSGEGPGLSNGRGYSTTLHQRGCGVDPTSRPRSPGRTGPTSAEGGARLKFELRTVERYTCEPFAIASDCIDAIAGKNPLKFELRTVER